MDYLDFSLKFFVQILGACLTYLHVELILKCNLVLIVASRSALEWSL